MNTLIVAGGEINSKDILKYCKEDIRTKYHCC